MFTVWYFDLTFLTSFLGTFADLQRATISFFMSVCLHGSSQLPVNWIFMKFYILVFFKNILRKFMFDSNLTRIMGTLQEDICTFVTITCWILLSIRKISDKSCRENQNTHFTYSNFLFLKIMKCMRQSGKIW
jgi:hypothetical protein